MKWGQLVKCCLSRGKRNFLVRTWSFFFSLDALTTSTLRILQCQFCLRHHGHPLQHGQIHRRVTLGMHRLGMRLTAGRSECVRLSGCSGPSVTQTRVEEDGSLGSHYVYGWMSHRRVTAEAVTEYMYAVFGVWASAVSVARRWRHRASEPCCHVVHVRALSLILWLGSQTKPIV